MSFKKGYLAKLREKYENDGYYITEGEWEEILLKEQKKLKEKLEKLQKGKTSFSKKD